MEVLYDYRKVHCNLDLLTQLVCGSCYFSQKHPSTF